MLHEPVEVMIAVALHRLHKEEPQILCVQYEGAEKFVLPFDYMRKNERPYRSGLRIVNSVFQLGLSNVRLRCYYMDRQDSLNGAAQNPLFGYYALKLKDDEVEMLEQTFKDLMSQLPIQKAEWVSCMPEKSSVVLDEPFNFAWEILRQSVASNYRVDIQRKPRFGR